MIKGNDKHTLCVWPRYLWTGTLVQCCPIKPRLAKQQAISVLYVSCS